MHESIVNQCGFDNTVKKEIEMLKNEANSVSNFVYPYKKASTRPLLTLAVPSYNVSKYLRNSIFLRELSWNPVKMFYMRHILRQSTLKPSV